MSNVPATPIDALIMRTVEDLVEQVTNSRTEISAADCIVFPCHDCGEPHLQVSRPKFRILIELNATQASEWKRTLSAAAQS